MTVQENIQIGFVSAGESAFISFVLNEIMPWTLHTVAAFASAGCVAVGLFFLNKWLKKNFK